MTCHLTPVRLRAPDQTPVSLDEAKAHLRVPHSEDDLLIEALIAAATERLDGWAGILGLCLVNQLWRFHAPSFHAPLRLPLGPLQEIDEIAYRDADGSDQTVPPSDYRLLTDSRGTYLVLSQGSSWPVSLASAEDAVGIVAQCGFGGPDEVPAPIRAAILLMVGDLYRFTETATAGAISQVPMSLTVDRLITPYRRVRL